MLQQGSITNKLGGFTFWVIASQIFGLTSVVMIGVWMGHFRGGFNWTDKTFNYHPLFMVIGFIFLYGNAILVYRIFRNEKKMYIKALHAAMQVFALIFAAVGLKAVFDSHNKGGIPNMYSLHSWLGIITVLLFALQWLVGLISFLFPKLSMEMRTKYKPLHVYWGMAIFVMAAATSVMGITEKVIFSTPGYSKKPTELIVANLAGLFIVSLVVTVIYLVSNSNYAREPTIDEEHVQLTE